MTSLLDQYGRPLATSQPARQSRFQEARATMARVRAIYDAAVTNDENRRHWKNADGLSVNALNSAERRRIIRNRARYEVANNSYARGIVNTLANDTIGTGPRLQMLLPDKEANTVIEQQFARWSRSVRLAEKLRTMRICRAESGEAFLVLRTNRGLPGDVKLDVALVEPDQVTTPDLFWDSPNAVDGIRFDNQGNPIEYHVLKHHPGDLGGLATMDYDRLPAAQVIHYLRCDRPGQQRGISEIMPALPLFAMLRGFTLAVLAAAETAADFCALLYTEMPAGQEAEEGQAFESMEIERKMMTTIPAGWKISQLKAEQPVSTYKEFKHEILNEISRALNMPFNVAAGNSAGYNYASGRLDHQVYFKSLRVDQAQIEEVILDRLLTAWFDEALLIPGHLPNLGPVNEWPHLWFWDGHEHVDPSKEASAQRERLANLTTTLSDEWAKKGCDWEVKLRQRAKELELQKELGITTAQGVPAASAEDEEEEEDSERKEAAHA